jgi:sulfur relay protein TusB/DsrH
LTHQSEIAQQLQQALSADDMLLYMAQGIYSVLNQPLLYTQAIYMLASDVTTTGIQPPPAVTVIDYGQFVALGARHERSLSWS